MSRTPPPPSPSRSSRSRCRDRGGRGPRSRTRAARPPRGASPRPPRCRRPEPRGRGGWAAPRSSSRFDSTSLSSASSSLSSALTSRISAISGSASSPTRLASAIFVRGTVLPRAPLLDLGQQLAGGGRRRPAARRARRRRLGAPARPSRDPGSSRMLRRSSTTSCQRAGSLVAERHRVAVRSPTANRSPAAGPSSGRWSPRTSRRTARPGGLAAGDDVLGHDRAGETAVANREDDVVVALHPLVEVGALHADRAVGRALGARRPTACDSPSSAARRARRRE